ncbi:MAG: hypothetical protein QOJ48_2149, partial [Frankiales bacterium]|nr:hypothetical protein [Frankiales bacterium]
AGGQHPVEQAATTDEERRLVRSTEASGFAAGEHQGVVHALQAVTLGGAAGLRA